MTLDIPDEARERRAQIRNALAETDSAWGEETGDGDANPDYIDTLTESLVYLRDVTPQSRDRVRVIVESTVDQTGYYQGIAYVEEGRATVEILERADDPSRDPIGTTATRIFNGHVRQWVKMDINRWVNPGYGWSDRSDADMTGRVVTGAVPGTPAAQARQGENSHDHITDDGRCFGCEPPLVVQYGDPEPDRKSVWLDRDGDYITFAGFHSEGFQAWGPNAVRWQALSPSRFPLTEVVKL